MSGLEEFIEVEEEEGCKGLFIDIFKLYANVACPLVKITLHTINNNRNQLKCLVKNQINECNQ